MNKYNKEYEEMSLCDFADELVEPLFTIKQDLTKAIYIHYAKERDENEQLQQENKELHNKIDKAIALYKNCKAEDYCTLDLDMYNALIGGDVDD